MVRGDEDARRRLDEIGDRASDLSGAWDRLLPQLRREQRIVFATRGHGRWPANDPKTIRQKGHDRPMVDSGKLLAALTLPGAPGSVAQKRNTSLAFGVDDRSIYWAKFVGKRRPFIVSERIAGRLGADAVNDYLTGG